MHHIWQMLFLSRASITTTDTLKIKEDSMNEFHLTFSHINIIIYVEDVNKGKKGAKRGQNF